MNLTIGFLKSTLLLSGNSTQNPRNSSDLCKIPDLSNDSKVPYFWAENPLKIPTRAELGLSASGFINSGTTTKNLLTNPRGAGEIIWLADRVDRAKCGLFRVFRAFWLAQGVDRAFWLANYQLISTFSMFAHDRAVNIWWKN